MTISTTPNATTYDQLHRVITDGIAEIREAYADPKEHHKRDGAIEGFEACRGKAPADLVALWSKAEKVAAQIARRRNAPEDADVTDYLPTARCAEVRLNRRRARRGPVMKLIIYQHDDRPIEIETSRFRLMTDKDHFEMREQSGHGNDGSSLHVRLEEHDGGLALDLAVFPNGGNAVRLKGGLR